MCVCAPTFLIPFYVTIVTPPALPAEKTAEGPAFFEKKNKFNILPKKTVFVWECAFEFWSVEKHIFFLFRHTEEQQVGHRFSLF